MAVDKRIPRVLNSDADSKTINKVSMLDALNFYSGPDNEGFQNGVKSDSGEGVLKNIKGTQEVFVHEGEELPTNCRVLGSVEDPKTSITYFFVYSTNGTDHGVWAYDKNDVLNTITPGVESSNTPFIRLIYKSKQFNFPQNGFVKGDIVYSNASRSFPSEMGDAFEKDVIIYFTDGSNEPRKINAYRAFVESSGSNIYSGDVYAEADFITACPKTPLKPIAFSFSQDEEKSVNNFSRSPGFQFAYQHIYIDGFESAISPYSDVAIPPVLINQGAATNVNDIVENRCDLTIPGSGPEIKSVRLLARQGNTGSFLIVDEVDAQPDPFVYKFYNDRILKGVSTDTVNKQFDSLPRSAKAQTVSSNRLMYGNYLDGFNPPNVTASCTVSYKERPEDFLQFAIRHIPSVAQHGFFTSGQTISDGNSFYLDFTEIPDTLPEGTSVSFSLTISPQRNWHLYKNQTTSQTVQRGPQAPSNLNNLHNEVNFNQSNSLFGAQDQDDISGLAIGNEIYEAHVDAENIFSEDNVSGDLHPAGGKIWGGPIDEIGAANNQGLLAIGSSWKRVFAPSLNVNNLDQGTSWASEVPDGMIASCGTSASNPIIIEGQPITFKVSFLVTSELNQARRKFAVASAFALTNPNIPEGYDFLNECDGIRLLEAQSRYTYSFDLGLQGGDIIEQHPLYEPGNTTIPSSTPKKHSGKICAVHGRIETDNGLKGSSVSGVPVGYFIVNKGTPTFGLRQLNQRYYHPTEFPQGPAQDHAYYDEYLGTNYASFLTSIGVGSTNHAADNACLLNLGLRDIQDVEIHTCIHDTKRQFDNYTTPKTQWIVLDDAALDEIQETQDLDGWLDSQAGYSSSNFQGFANVPGGNGGVPAINATNGYANQVGRLDYPILDGPTFIQGVGAVQNFVGTYGNPVISNSIITDFAFSFSLNVSVMDGEGGPGGGPAQGFAEEGSNHPYDICRLYNQGSVTVNPGFQIINASQYIYYAGTVFYGGCMTPFKLTGESNITLGSGQQPTILPFLLNRSDVALSVDGYSVNPKFEYQIPQGPPPTLDGIVGEIYNSFDNDGGTGVPSVNFKLQQSPAEAINVNTSFASGGENYGEGNESFKTKANHSFGVVYYDERGRHGFVHPLKIERPDGTLVDSQYVKALGERTSDEGLGSVEINLTLNGEPPEWAHTYKIVYGGNTTVQDFVQYTIGAAFVGGDPGDVAPGGDTNKNIYLSLNYLQGHPVSYVSAFGARTPEGGLNLYKFEEGDKLNVISYGPGNERIYVDHQFEIVDLVNLGATDNPLTSQENPEENQKGQFLVVRDNASASGFNHSSVAFTDQSNWEKNCTVELRTDKKNLDPEDQVYYESSDSYRVLKTATGQLIHEENPVTLSKGDVWFRRVATNVKQIQSGNYIDIIVNDDGADPAPQPNFTNVYLETESASDLFRSNSLSYKGRPNVVFEGEAEIRREATITYSDPSNPESKILNYPSFNASLANFKDLSERYGDIQYIGDHNGYIYVIQKERISMIPTDKNVLSDASGASQLIASLNVLGEIITYPEVSGCDDDPSSVYDSGSNVYFCNKELSKVYRWTRSGGVEDISEKGVSSFIRAALQRAMNTGQVRVVGGFDPLKDEYLLSIQNLEEYDTPVNIEIVNQPLQTIAPEDEDDGSEEGGDTEALGGNLEVIPDSLTFNNVEIGQTADQVVIFRTTTNDPINIDSISFTNPEFSISPAQPFPIVLIPEFGITNIPVSVFFTPSSTDTISGEMEIITNDPNQALVTIDVEGNGISTLSPGGDPIVSPATVAFTEAYNDFYLTNISPEDMSAELAIDYLKDLKDDPNEANHPTFSKIFELLSITNRIKTRRFLSDTLGSISYDGVGSVGATELDGEIGAIELTAFLSTYQTTYDTESSMFTESEPTPTVLPPPSTSSLPLFNNTQEAVDYLIAAGNMTVWNFYQFFSQAQMADFRHLYNVNNVGTITITDFLEILAVFGGEFLGSETAFNSSYPGPTIENPEFTAEQVLGFIQQQHLSGVDPMTVGQFYQLGQYIRSEIRLNGTAPGEYAAQGGTTQEDGNNTTFSVTTADLLIFLGLIPSGVTGGTNDWVYDMNDPIFGL